MTVLDHTCTGLEAFELDSQHACHPVITDEGQVSGCDASNRVLIQFCPWCGTQLRQDLRMLRTGAWGDDESEPYDPATIDEWKDYDDAE